MREVRDVSGAITSQYFRLGQVNSSTDYFYQLSHRGDVIGVTNSSGSLVSSSDFDPYGRRVVLASAFTPDLGFTGLYVHQRSGLNLAVYRTYSSDLGRWINRDPLGERGAINLYGYAVQNPVSFADPSGLAEIDWGLSKMPQTPGPH